MHKLDDELLGEEETIINAVMELETQLSFLNQLIASIKEHHDDLEYDINDVIASIKEIIETVEIQIMRLHGTLTQIHNTVEFEMTQIRHLLAREARLQHVLQDQERIAEKMESISKSISAVHDDRRMTPAQYKKTLESVHSLQLLVRKMKQSYNEATEDAGLLKVTEDQIERIINHIRPRI